MTLRSIPCILFRGGSSKGPFFHLEDLPADPAARARVLLAIMGSPDIRQIDGLGGADPLTSKVAIVAPSTRDGIDVDYHFAQVSIDRAFVDTSPSCGNMLAGVGPFAIETRMVPATDPSTRVRIHDVNTGCRVVSTVRTREGRVVYGGETAIAGVPGTAAPIRLDFLDIQGCRTGALLPTGLPREEIDGVEVTLIDVAVPMMIVRADSVGKTGGESPADLDADHAFLDRLESLRREAGHRMGLGDVAGRVLPKVALLSRPVEGGHIRARYFVPQRAHPAMAVTGAFCIASCAILEGSVSDDLAVRHAGEACEIHIEHPSGLIAVHLSTSGRGAELSVEGGGIIRTARKILSGQVFVPEQLLLAE